MSNETTTSKYFLITAGGTGMRCLQSFVNLCGLGLMKNTSVDVLLLDTDAHIGLQKKPGTRMRGRCHLLLHMLGFQ